MLALTAFIAVAVSMPSAQTAEPVSAVPSSEGFHVDLVVSGFGAAETSWIKAFHERVASDWLYVAQRLRQDGLTGRLSVTYADDTVTVVLERGNFDPARTPTVLDGYPSPYLVYALHHVVAVQQLSLGWVQLALRDPTLPLTLRTALANPQIVAAFARPDKPGTTLFIGSYLSQGVAYPVPPATVVEGAGTKAVAWTVMPVGHRSDTMWAIPPMVGADGQETAASHLWRFMGWDTLYPQKSGRAVP